MDRPNRQRCRQAIRVVAVTEVGGVVSRHEVASVEMSTRGELGRSSVWGLVKRSAVVTAEVWYTAVGTADVWCSADN